MAGSRPGNPNSHVRVDLVRVRIGCVPCWSNRGGSGFCTLRTHAACHLRSDLQPLPEAFNPPRETNPVTPLRTVQLDSRSRVCSRC
eukprot:4531051-Pyramimonas_sp.AAC.1